MSLLTGLVGCFECVNGTLVDQFSRQNTTPPTPVAVPVAGSGGPTMIVLQWPATINPKGYVTPINNQFGDFTFAVWFQANPAGGFERLVDKDFTTGTWIGRNSGAAQWGGGVQENTSPYGIFVGLTDSQWHHVVSRRSGATHTMVGDQWASSATNTVTTSLLSTNYIYIGDEASGSSGYGAGSSIAQVCIWNRAIDDLEISKLFNNGNGLPYPFNIRRMGRPIGSRITGR